MFARDLEKLFKIRPRVDVRFLLALQKAVKTSMRCVLSRRGRGALRREEVLLVHVEPPEDDVAVPLEADLLQGRTEVVPRHPAVRAAL